MCDKSYRHEHGTTYLTNIHIQSPQSDDATGDISIDVPEPKGKEGAVKYFVAKIRGEGEKYVPKLRRDSIVGSGQREGGRERERERERKRERKRKRNRKRAR